MQSPSQTLQSTPIAAPTTYVSDLKPTFVMNGWGSGHLDRSNGEKDDAGNTISIRGKTYAKGLGVHADSEVDVALNGNYSHFVSDIGVDDEKNGLGTVDFKVLADGKQIFDSGAVTGKDAVKHVDLDVSGKQKLQLFVAPGAAGIDYDHADWAGAALTPIVPQPSSSSSSNASQSSPLPPSSGSQTNPAPSSSNTPDPAASKNGTTYFVSTSGNDSADGSKDHPWKTIQHAVDSKSPIQAGDTVLVESGTYNEEVTIAKSGSQNNNITLKADGNVTLNDPNPTGGQFEDGTIQTAPGVSNLTIDGFTIQNSSWAGIALHDAHNITVQNNHTEKTGSSGIIALPGSYYGGGDQEVTSSNIKVLNNSIDQANNRYYEGSPSIGQQEALSIWGVDGFEVAGNKVTNGNTEGIDVKIGSRNGSVHNNDVSGSAAISGESRHGGPAIYLDGNRANEFNIDVYGNNVHDNHADGIRVADEDPSKGSVSNIKIHDNTITGNGIPGVNGGQGIGIYPDVSGVEVYNNTTDKDIQAFYVDGDVNGANQGVKDVNIHDNTFTGSIYRNGYIGNNVSNLTLANNKLSKQFSSPYDKSGTQTNFKDTGNTAI